MFTVSVVIPTYNGSHYLAEAVRSVLAQSYGILEIIVVDDGSQDDIEKILAPFFPKVTYVRQENAGPAAARNLGISLAKGNFVAFLDDDDIWHPTKTAEQVKLLIENPKCALVYSNPEWIDEAGRVIPYRGPMEFPGGEVYVRFLTRNWIGTTSGALVRREVFDEIGLFDENMECFCGEDYDLWVRIARDYEVIFCPGNLLSYRVRSSGISKNLDKALTGDLYVLDKFISQHLKEPKLTDNEFYKAIDTNRHQTLRRFAYSYYYMSEDRTKARRLLSASLQINPYSLKDISYLVALYMPTPLFQALRKTKQRVSATVTSLGLIRKPA